MNKIISKSAADDCRSRGRKFYLHDDARIVRMSRLPTDLRSPRMGALARLPVFFALDGKRAWWPAAARLPPGRPNCSRLPVPGSTFLRRTPRTTCWRSLRLRLAAPSQFIAAAGRLKILLAPPSRSPTARTRPKPRNSPPPHAPQACRSMSSTVRHSAIFPSAPSSTARRSSSASPPTAPSPVFGQVIRAKIEALIPKGFARWAEAARNWRPRVQALGLPFRGTAQFLGAIHRARGRGA